MDKTTRIRALLRSIAGTERTRCAFRLMEVTKVDGDCCRARIGGFELGGIRLASIAGGADEGLLLTPAVGSIVLVADLSDGELRELNAIGYSAIDALRYHRGSTTVVADTEAITLTVGDTTLRVEDGAIRLGGKDHGGLVQVEELQKSLRSLKTYCETLRAAISDGLNGVGTGTAASGEKGAKAFASKMSGAAIKLEKMENTNVTH